MKNILFAILSIGILLGVSPRLQAIAIGFDSVVVHSTFLIGDTIDIPLIVSGLGDTELTTLGAFDISISYSPFILDLQTVAFGDPVLGDQLDFSGLDLLSFGFAGFTEFVGSVNLFEISLDPAGLLVAFQADSFVLATLTFEALNNGSSPLDIAGFPFTVLSDSIGNELPAIINDSSIKVPVPATFWLIGLGLLGFGRINRGFA